MKIVDISLGVSAQAWAVADLLLEYDVPDNQEFSTSTWYNGRERGLVFSVCYVGENALHVAVFQHRNSDDLCAVKWHAPPSINPPTLEESMPLAYPEDDKSKVSYSVPYGHISEMTDWVKDQLLA